MRTSVDLGSAGSRLFSALGDATDLLRLTRPQPPTSVLRGVKTFWNVATDKGLKVGVVNWWATWPAEAVNGFMVSDRAFFKLDRGGAPDREVFPPEVFDTLRPLALPGSDDLPRRLDRFAVSASRTLARNVAPDLEALYLPGLDIFTEQAGGAPASADLAGLEDRLSRVRAYYRFVDGLVGEVATGLSPDEVVLIVGDPGRLARTGDVAPRGLLVLAGGPVSPRDLGEVSERDVAPTVLHLLGLPTSAELTGHVLEGALDPAFRAAHPVRVVASLGRRSSARAADSAFDEQMIEELRSLGYIQ
jgi:hypothetical protein